MSSQPYGPMTAAVRRFLVELAALELDAHNSVVSRFDALSRTRAFSIADATVGEVIERSGRTDARDALAGPLLQLVRLHVPTEGDDATARALDDAAHDDAPVPLDPIAEPALAALLALLVRDLLPADAFKTLYAPFAEIIPPDPAPV